MEQTTFFKEVNGKVIVNNFAAAPDESRDEILKARFTPTVAENIRAFCRGRKISVTDYLRRYASLGDVYYDHIDTLTDPEVQQFLIPMLQKIRKKI